MTLAGRGDPFESGSSDPIGNSVKYFFKNSLAILGLFYSYIIYFNTFWGDLVNIRLGNFKIWSFGGPRVRNFDKLWSAYTLKALTIFP